MKFHQYLNHKNDDHYPHYSKELFTFLRLDPADTLIQIMDADHKNAIQSIHHPRFTFFPVDGMLNISGFVYDGKKANIWVSYRFYSEETVKESIKEFSDTKFVKAKFHGQIFGAK